MLILGEEVQCPLNCMLFEYQTFRRITSHVSLSTDDVHFFVMIFSDHYQNPQSVCKLLTKCNTTTNFGTIGRYRSPNYIHLWTETVHVFSYHLFLSVFDIIIYHMSDIMI